MMLPCVLLFKVVVLKILPETCSVAKQMQTKAVKSLRIKSQGPSGDEGQTKIGAQGQPVMLGSPVCIHIPELWGREDRENGRKERRGMGHPGNKSNCAQPSFSRAA